MRAGTLLVCGLGALGVAALAGCPTFGVDVCEGDACGTTGGDDGGKDGATDGGQILPAGCDLTKDPSESPACVDDTVGVFVSATGSDGAAGTKSAPVKTLSAALGKVSTQRSRVYVCEGTYAGAVAIDGSQSSALSGVYGGFTCSDWKTGGAKAKLVAGAGEVVLTVKSVASSLVVTDLDVEATSVASTGDAGASDGGAGGSAGASSIAAMVLSSKGVVLRRVKLVGGDASDGAPTPKTSNYDEALAATDPKIKGHDAPSDNTGGTAQTCADVCLNKIHATGGKGGDANAAGQSGDPMITPNPSGAVPPHDGAAGTSGCGTGAHIGADAVPADGGAAAPAAVGKLDGSGWKRTDGASGATGGVAQGGGGGGGGAVSGSGGGGGSGGCGGCGGAGGAGGMSGGSSFALLSYQSTVTLDACDLHAGKGGSGQAGGNGQVGQTGGNRGEPASGGTGCPGAAGGKGGDGAGGGGGAGGHASAVGYVGTAPAASNGTTLGKGTAGQGAAGGSGGTPPAGAGANGQAVESLKLE